jgi:hypothetical protein
MRCTGKPGPDAFVGGEWKTVRSKRWGQVFILDNRIGNNVLSEPQNAQDAKLLAPVIFMFGTLRGCENNNGQVCFSYIYRFMPYPFFLS